MKRSPYFELGAARSGTKILRDTLETHPRIQTTNYPLEDEIWKWGQEDSPDDLYPPDSITKEIKNHVKKKFEAKMSPDKQFIEKNVNHCLRIPYITTVYPDTKFIHIIRDGRDVICSAMKMWKNPVDWKYYLFSKGQELSPKTILFYLGRLGRKILKRIVSGKKRVDYFGIKIPGHKQLVEENSLLEICARQWKVAVNKAAEDGRKLGSNQYFELHYESLMKSPDAILPELANFLDLKNNQYFLQFAKKQYRDSSIGQWKKMLSANEQERLNKIIGPTLNQFNYEVG